MELEIDFLGSKYTLVSHENDAQYYPLLWIEAAIGANYFTVNLAVLKEISQELADLFVTTQILSRQV
jgi:hypothetical protein